MTEIINYLNTNQGAVIAALTFVYVIATLVIVYFNKRSIDEMRTAREEEMRPYIFAYLAFVPRESKSFTLVIRNYGKSGARITSFNVNPELSLIPGKSSCAFLEKTILAPGQSIRLLVWDPDVELDKETFCVQIAYESVDCKSSFSENYSLIQQYANQSGYVDTSRSGSSKSENALLNIASSLDTIKTNML